MLDWKEILKVQVLDTSTGLSTINESMIEDENCCENAFQRYKELHDEILNYRAELKKFDFSDSGTQLRRYIKPFLNITDLDLTPDILGQFITPRNDSSRVCLDFFDFLGAVQARLRHLLTHSFPPLTPQALSDKGGKIQDELDKILNEWVNCDDEIHYRYWGEFRNLRSGTTREKWRGKGNE
mgnify:FL=1|tara:strand:+ start:124 stop:669 length:546 start_codon:yes stop_codon:yes gene_type:complete